MSRYVLKLRSGELVNAPSFGRYVDAFNYRAGRPSCSSAMIVEEISHRPADQERERQVLDLRARAPLQSKGKAVADVAHLPLFIAGNEPSLF